MSLHIFIKGNVKGVTEKIINTINKEDYEHFFVNPHLNISPEQGVLDARKYWTKYIHKEYKIGVITNSDFFLKEINILIMLNYLSIEDRNKLFKGYKDGLVLDSIYNKRMFSNEFGNLNLNIRCFDLELNEECNLDIEFGFECKTFDKIINFQNELQEAVAWWNYD